MHPGQWPPTILAKLGATAQDLHDNRLALNVVSGWFKRGYTDLGLPWLDHEERYRRAEEFIEVLRGPRTVPAVRLRKWPDDCGRALPQ